MQYLLSEDEIEAMRRKIATLDRFPTVEKLQEFCTFVADNLVLKTGWAAGKSWGCILTKGGGNHGYCDDCPAKRVCPHPQKEWSK